MKKIMCIIIMLLMAIPVYASVTLERASDLMVKITTTTETVVVNNKTIASLREEKENLEVQKTNVTNSYDEQISILDEQIASIESQIAKAKELGVKEVSVEGDIVE